MRDLEGNDLNHLGGDVGVRLLAGGGDAGGYPAGQDGTGSTVFGGVRSGAVAGVVARGEEGGGVVKRHARLWRKTGMTSPGQTRCL